MYKRHAQFLISVAPLTRIALTRDQSFFYTFSRPLPPGTHVEIPIGKRTVEGIVTKSTKDFPRKSNFTIRPITMVIKENFLTHTQLQLAEFIATYYYCPLGVVLKHFIMKKVGTRYTEPTQPTLRNISTTPAQDELIQNMMCAKYQKFFFHTISQSDKVSTLFALAKKHAHNHTQTLYLLPELIQTPYFTDFVHQFFSTDTVAIIHSKLPKGVLHKKWCDIKSGKVHVIIGTRSALFAPFADLGAVIVDDAHDMSHKQWDHTPLYDTRTVADTLAQLHHCPYIMTSVTPRTIDYAHKNRDTDTTFISHANHKKPPIEIVDMKKERWDKNTSPLSRTLMAHIRTCLRQKKQTLLFVNRQGMSAFSVCTKCRHVVTCPQCTRALIATQKGTHLCRHCNTEIPSSKKCHACGAPMEHIGIGTEHIHKELRKHFPTARIAIADTSTMRTTRAHKKIYDDFVAHNIDIIIGTQMITKDWQTRSVGITAIIDADHLQNIPDYTTNERMFAFIIQMALRTPYGKLIVQTFTPEHPVVQYAQQYDFDGFHTEESAVRSALKYPPHTRLVKLVYRDTTKKRVEQEVAEAHKHLTTLFSADTGIIISEPHFPLVDKVRTKFHKQIIIKITDITLPIALDHYLKTLDTKWRIDIDPVQIV